ncbi:MAG: CpsD/CapB family tyrosine-protein kinase [Nocardioidaceae bacterium]
MITGLDSHAPRLEAFRVLRTNMQFVDVDRDSKVFAVSSSVPGEGKTTTATNLAITLAQAGQRVLMIDGDMRRPHVARAFGLESIVGLTTVLIGSIDLEDAIQDGPVDTLSVLTSGAIPPNPSELLQSQAMRDLLERAKKEYDVIVIDTPPLLPVTDAALVAAQADGALVVVRHGSTTRDQLRHSIERLEAVDARALGVVLNMMPSRRGGRDTYGYGYGYGYAPESGRKRR